MDVLIMVDEIPDLGAIYRKDSGCRKSPHCLDCPLPLCVHDEQPRAAAAGTGVVGGMPAAKRAASAPAAKSKPSLGNRDVQRHKASNNVQRDSGTTGQSAGRPALPTRPVQTTCPNCRLYGWHDR